MKLAQISDWHCGITTEGQIKQQLRLMQKEQPDIIVNCGDNNGGASGAKATKRVARLIRQFFPTIPILWVQSNHDRWCVSNKRKRTVYPYTGHIKYIKTAPGPEDYYQNLKDIEDVLKDNSIHFLDKDGIFIHPDFKHVVFIGASGWYGNPNPPTNDWRWLPIGLEGDTNRFILKTTEDDLFRAETQLQQLPFEAWQTLVFVSHFPVINTGNDYKGAFEDFSWRASLGDFFQETYGCRYFLCGHAHQRHQGPLRYECGSDYRKPKYQIINI